MASAFSFQRVTALLDAQKNFEQLQSLLEGFGKRVRVYNSADLTVPDDTGTTLTFDSEEFDTELDIDTMHSPGDSKLFVKTAGVYNVWANVTFAAEDGGQRSLQIRLNGETNIATINRAPLGGSTDDSLAVAASWYFNAGDYVEVVVYQTNTAHNDVAVVASPSTSPEFGMTWASP